MAGTEELRRHKAPEGDPQVRDEPGSGPNGVAGFVAEAMQMLVAAAIAIIALDILWRTVVGFLANPASYPVSVMGALDGILVVIILLDILRTLTSHYETPALPVRPFLAIGVLAAVRDILSASAHLALGGRISPVAFRMALLQMAAGVVVAFALVGALILAKRAEPEPVLLPWRRKRKARARPGNP